MISLYTGEFENRKELHRKEREFFEELKATLNCLIPAQTQKEWHAANLDNINKLRRIYASNNKEAKAKQDKKYRDNNKEKLKQKSKQYYENNKDHLIKKAKKYVDNNKEKTTKNKNQWYLSNRERILNKITQKLTCECGTILSKCNMRPHLKTKKHIEWSLIQTV